AADSSAARSAHLWPAAPTAAAAATTTGAATTAAATTAYFAAAATGRRGRCCRMRAATSWQTATLPKLCRLSPAAAHADTKPALPIPGLSVCGAWQPVEQDVSNLGCVYVAAAPGAPPPSSHPPLSYVGPQSIVSAFRPLPLRAVAVPDAAAAASALREFDPPALPAAAAPCCAQTGGTEAAAAAAAAARAATGAALTTA
ncbi:unnamed protein product, partial [Rangifer tarandus platyrhynchus]